MIEEAYVSFETAKLAKEKEFDEEFENMHVWNNFKGEILEDVSGYNMKNSHLCKNSYSAPTQSLLARWLREKYNVHVIPKPIYDSDRLEQYGCDIHCPDKNGLVFTIISHVFPVYKQTPNHNMTKELGTYEEAMEEGLKEALKLKESEETDNKDKEE